MNESSILTEQEIINAWPALAQTTYADIRSAVVRFTTAVQALETNYQPPVIDNQMLLHFIGILEKQGKLQDVAFVQAILKLAFPTRNENIFCLIHGFILVFNQAYSVLQENQLLERVKSTIQEAADPARSDIVQHKDIVHNMYSICVALHLISGSTKLFEKYKANLLSLLIKLFTNNEMKYEYDVSRFFETIIKDSFIAADLNFTKALTNHGFKGATCFVLAISGRISGDAGRKTAQVVLAVVEKHGFIGADELYNVINRKFSEYEQRKIVEPLLSVATRWGYDGFKNFQVMVDYLYITINSSPIVRSIVEFWRERFFSIAEKHRYAGIDQFNSVLHLSLSRCFNINGNIFSVELAKQAFIESYLGLNGFKGILDYYVSLPAGYDQLLSDTAGLSVVSKESNQRELFPQEKTHKTSLMPVEKGKVKEIASDNDEQKNNKTSSHLSADSMSQLNSLIIVLESANNNALQVTSVTELNKKASENSLFSTKSIYNLLKLKPRTVQTAPADNLHEQNIAKAEMLLQAQLYFLKKLRDLLSNPDLIGDTVSSIVAQAKVNTQTIFKCENLITGEMEHFIKSIDNDVSKATSTKMRSSMSA